MLVFIVTVLFITLFLRLSTFLMNLDISTHQIARSTITVGEIQTEAVVATGFAVVNNNNRVNVGTLTVYLCNAFDLTCHGIDDDVLRNARALDLHAIVVIV